MLEHEYLVYLSFYILVIGLVWLIVRTKFKDTYKAIKELKPLYRILIYFALAGVAFLFMVLTSKFDLMTAILIIGIPGALLGFLI